MDFTSKVTGIVKGELFALPVMVIIAWCVPEDRDDVLKFIVTSWKSFIARAGTVLSAHV